MFYLEKQFYTWKQHQPWFYKKNINTNCAFNATTMYKSKICKRKVSMELCNKLKLWLQKFYLNSKIKWSQSSKATGK